MSYIFTSYCGTTRTMQEAADDAMMSLGGVQIAIGGDECLDDSMTAWVVPEAEAEKAKAELARLGFEGTVAHERDMQVTKPQ